MDINEATKAGDLPAVQQILKTDPGAVHFGSPGEQPLHYAAWLNHPEILRELLAHGAEINCRDAEQRTSLHYAALNNHPEIARHLIEARAELDPIDQYGFTPAVYAIRERTPEGEEIFAMLMAAGAAYGIHEAIARGHTTGVRNVLQDDHAAVTRFPNQEQLLVDAMIGYGRYDGDNPKEILRLLFEHGLKVPTEVVLLESDQAEAPDVKAMLRNFAQSDPKS